jgi:membrane protease YdiL (CAAX protease family)
LRTTVQTCGFFTSGRLFFVAFLPNIEILNLKTGLIILGISIINGTVEEVYWRGLYLREYKENRFILLIVSPLLFASMHSSFLLIKGMNYQGGVFALVGGAFLMGLLWSYVSFRLNNIRYCIAGHIFVNIFAFTGLFVENGLQFLLEKLR